jgi:hypothetical protein
MDAHHPDLRTVAILRRALGRLDRESSLSRVAGNRLGSSIAACHVQHALDALLGEVTGPHDPVAFDEMAASRLRGAVSRRAG